MAGSAISSDYPYVFSVLFADAQVIAGYLYGHGVSKRGNHFYRYRLTRYTAHFHQGKLKIALFMLFYYSKLPGRQLRKA